LIFFTMKRFFSFLTMVFGVLAVAKVAETKEVNASVSPDLKTVGRDSTCDGPGDFCGRLDTVVVVWPQDAPN
ncbi:hypothetical protein, partial [Capnocytophaga canis]